MLALHDRGVAHYDKHDYERAIADFEQLVKLNVNMVVAADPKDRGRPAARLRPAASRSRRSQLRLNPSFALAFNDRGLEFSSKGEFDQAIADYNQSIKINPNHARGLLQPRQRLSTASAISTARWPTSTRPSSSIRRSALAYYDRGLTYYEQRDYDRAVADFDTALKIDPKDAFAYYNRGIAQYGRHDFDRAIADFSQAIKLDGKIALAFHNRGNA